MLDAVLLATVIAFKTPDNWHRQLEHVWQQQCIAEAVWHEARNGTDDDMALVAYVTLFRGDPCHETAKPGQFPWYGTRHTLERRRAMKVRYGEAVAWDRATLVAVRVFTGEMANPCQGAYFYNHVGGRNPTGTKRKADCVTGKLQGWRE